MNNRTERMYKIAHALTQTLDVFDRYDGYFLGDNNEYYLQPIGNKKVWETIGWKLSKISEDMKVQEVVLSRRLGDYGCYEGLGSLISHGNYVFKAMADEIYDIIYR